MWTIFKESKMKKLLCLSVGTVALLLGCSVQKEEDPVFGGYETYYASFEDSFTKTVAGDDGSVLWMKNDQITIFEKSTVGHAFKFTGRNGAHSGGFSMVEGSDYGAGEPMECYYAVYPHSDDNTLETTGELILTFPSEQSYEADSFGPGANLSVAKSDNNHFSFKNVGGYLTFSLYGDDVTVSSITLKGNNGEKIAGDMSVFMEEGFDPASSFLSGKYYNTYTEITLTCDPGVKLGATSDEGTAFWFVVPPISFENGLTFIVRDTQGNTFTKSSTKARTIARSERTGFNPIQVSFSVPVSSVSLNKSETTLTVGATEALVATVAPANATDKTVSWSSSNTSVATVSDGTVTAKGVGTTTITATAGGKSATCTVTVTPILVSSITLSSSTASVNVGSTVTLTATATPTNAADKTVSWSSSNTGVATVSSTGVVTGVASGMATITATANDGSGVTASCTVTVSNVAVTGVTLNKTTLSLVNGNSETLTATVAPANATDKTVSWSSSNTSVATVSDGTVTAKGVGTTTITATAGGKSATCTVTVTPILVSSITLSSSTASVNVGSTVTLTATATPTNAADKTVSWSSSNTGVATVSSSGVVTGVASGTATITATANDGSGVTATCSVTVNNNSVQSISLNKSLFALTIGSTEVLTASITPIDATDKSVTWSSTKASVASVSSRGKVTALAVGSTTIKVRTTDGGYSAECTVVVLSPDFEAVDLSLPSATKWASCNLGASKPEEYGDYYAWGETETKSEYNWATYKWCDGTSNTLTKYVMSASLGSVDKKTELESSDDVATVKLGGLWQIPTREQQKELLTYCTFKETTLNGISGWLVYRNNYSLSTSIFLPSAGWMADNGYAAGGFYYWTSHTGYYVCPSGGIDVGDAFGEILSRNWDYTNTCTHPTEVHRYIGCQIRPVLYPY